MGCLVAEKLPTTGEMNEETQILNGLGFDIRKTQTFTLCCHMEWSWLYTTKGRY